MSTEPPITDPETGADAPASSATFSAGALWAAMSGRARLIAVGAAGLLLFTLLMGTAGVVAHVDDWLVDRAEAKRAEGRAEEQKNTDAAIKRAVEAEARAAVLEEQTAALKQVAANAALSARQKERAAEEAERATQDAVAHTADMSPDEAREYARAELRRLGLLK